MPFEELCHTGDIQYRVTADTEEELFCESLKALFSTITDLVEVESKEERRVCASGDSPEDLLINFLRECLMLFAADEFVTGVCEVVLKGGDKVEALLRGERFDPQRHQFRTEIKAVTYHGSEVREENGKWTAVFTLDL